MRSLILAMLIIVFGCNDNFVFAACANPVVIPTNANPSLTFGENYLVYSNTSTTNGRLQTTLVKWVFGPDGIANTTDDTRESRLYSGLITELKQANDLIFGIYRDQAAPFSKVSRVVILNSSVGFLPTPKVVSTPTNLAADLTLSASYLSWTEYTKHLPGGVPVASASNSVTTFVSCSIESSCIQQTATPPRPTPIFLAFSQFTTFAFKSDYFYQISQQPIFNRFISTVDGTSSMLMPTNTPLTEILAVTDDYMVTLQWGRFIGITSRTIGTLFNQAAQLLDLDPMQMGGIYLAGFKVARGHPNQAWASIIHIQGTGTFATNTNGLTKPQSTNALDNAATLYSNNAAVSVTAQLDQGGRLAFDFNGRYLAYQSTYAQWSPANTLEIPKPGITLMTCS